MKLIELTFAGIGPFPGEHTIDFEAVGQTGLFLLSGPTGSGKSTIIDAISYALFSDVAGEKESSKDRLRSNFCSAHDPSYVRLKFSVPAGTYLIERTPQYVKPGNSTPTPAKATLWRIDSDQENPIPIASKSSQVGHEMTSLLPLKKEQFLQTMVLPQGKFNSFLSAESGEREKLLQTIFGTQIYNQIIEKLRDRTREYESHLETLEEMLVQSRNSYLEDVENFDLTWESLLVSKNIKKPESVSSGLPEDQLESFLQPHLSSEPLSAQAKILENTLAKIMDKIESRVEDASTWAKESRAQQETAMADLNEGKRYLKLKAEKIAAQEQQKVLSEDQEEIKNTREVIGLAKAAIPLLKIRQHSIELSQNLADFRNTLEGAEQAWEDIVNSSTGQNLLQLQPAIVRHDDNGLIEVVPKMTKRPEEIDSELLAELKDTLKTARYLEESNSSLEKKQTTTEAQYQKFAEQHKEQLEALTEMQAGLEDLRDQAAKLKGTSGQKETAAAKESHLRRQLDAWNQTESLEKQRALKSKENKELERQYDTASLALQHKMEQWQKNAASVLANALEDDAPCPVCGSLEHPKPTKHSSDAPTEEDINEARRVMKKASEDYLDSQTKVSQLSAQYDQMKASLEYDSKDVLQTELAEAVAVNQAATDAQVQLAEIGKQIVRDEEQIANQTTIIASLAQKASAEEAKLEETKASLNSSTSALKQLIHPYTTTEDAEHDLNTVIQRLGKITSLQEQLTTAENNLQQSEDKSNQELEESPFNTWEEANTAQIPQQQLSEYQSQVAQYEEQMLRVQLILERPEIQDLDLAAEEPDLADLQSRYEQLADQTQTWAEKNGSLQAIQKQVGQSGNRLKSVYAELTEHLNQNQALLKVSRLAQGKGSENEESISLATYVLVSKLEDILAHANPILSEISNGRYELTRTHKEARQKTRSTGLGLEIIDHFTDIKRSTKTLSGGEGFYTSLALALALSSVVTAEAGGIDIETMFIDEGFGTLSPDYLDAVITQLNQLTKSGTAIGIISHVDELKRQIGDKIQIIPQESGYSVLETNF